MESAVTVRSYKGSDHPALKMVLSESGMYYNVWDNRKAVGKKIRSSPGSVMVAVAGGNVIGCIYAQAAQPGWTSFLWRLAVLKKYRKKGVGTKLINNAEKFLARKGIKSASMLVDAKKPQLHSYYKKLGYKTAAHPYYYFMKR